MKTILMNCFMLTFMVCKELPNYVFSKDCCKTPLCGVLYSPSLCNILCAAAPFYQMACQGVWV